MSLGTILLIVLMLIGTILAWPAQCGWGRRAQLGGVVTGRAFLQRRWVRPYSSAALMSALAFTLAACSD